jgi:transposase
LEGSQVAKKAVMRYSEAFKLQVVRELETGKFESIGAAQRAYGVNGSETIAAWVRRFGKDHLLGKVIHVMKADEQVEVDKLRKQIRDLKNALEEAYLKLACEAAGIQDILGFKKKHDGKLQTG